MGMPKGKKIDSEALLQRRMKARQLLDAGSSQAEVARQLGVSREAVRKWAKMKLWRLKQVKRQGRKSAINEFKRDCLRSSLNSGPYVNGRPTFGKSSVFRMQQLLLQHAGREFSKSYAWRLRRELGPTRHRY